MWFQLWMVVPLVNLFVVSDWSWFLHVSERSTSSWWNLQKNDPDSIYQMNIYQIWYVFTSKRAAFCHSFPLEQLRIARLTLKFPLSSLSLAGRWSTDRWLALVMLKPFANLRLQCNAGNYLTWRWIAYYINHAISCRCRKQLSFSIAKIEFERLWWAYGTI